MDTSKIEYLRKIKGFTQKQVAESIGITVTGYQKMIEANDPKISILIKILNLFEVDIQTFFGASESVVNDPAEKYEKGGKSKLTYKLVDVGGGKSKLTFKISEVENMKFENNNLVVILKR